MCRWKSRRRCTWYLVLLWWCRVIILTAYCRSSFLVSLAALAPVLRNLREAMLVADSMIESEWAWASVNYMTGAAATVFADSNSVETEAVGNVEES